MFEVGDIICYSDYDVTYNDQFLIITEVLSNIDMYKAVIIKSTLTELIGFERYIVGEHKTLVSRVR